MKYALDTEFIDTETYSGLISLGLVCEDGREIYFEFGYPEHEMTGWLLENVYPHLYGKRDTFREAAKAIEDFCRNTSPEIWAYYGAYDWYWFCRIFGGMMNVPHEFENFFHEFLTVQRGIPNTNGPEHHALNDARSLMAAMKEKLNVPSP